MHCQDCIFAKVENDVQVGCKFGRLERYKEENIELSLKDGYFHAEALLGCSTKRDRKWEHAGRSEDVQIKNVMDSFVLKYDALFWSGFENLQLNLEDQLQLFKNSNGIKPNKIIIAFPDDPRVNTGALVRVLKNCGMQWSLVRQNVGSAPSHLISGGFQSVDSPYFYCSNLNDRIDLNLPSKFNLLLKAFHSTLLVHYDKYNFFTNSILFENTKGFEMAETDDGEDMTSYVDKVMYLSRKQNREYMVKTDAELETLLINMKPPTYLAKDHHDLYGFDGF